VPHPRIDNSTYALFEAIPALDENGETILVAIAKATFGFDARGGVLRIEEQPPIHLAPVYWGNPLTSSLRYDADVALQKPAADVVLLGHARSTHGPVDSLDVGIRVGPVQKVARVIGDRVWLRDGGSAVLSRPNKFEALPLRYERTFGGWDRTDPNPKKHVCEPRNPVGTGAGRPLRNDGETLRAPNIVDPASPAIGYGEQARPMGFGFVAPDWAPRAGFAGTYDEAWEKTRKPLLPRDFSRRFFNAASEGLVAPGFLKGNEQVTLVNVGSAPRIDFQLPGLEPPAMAFHFRNGRSTQVAGSLDTLTVDADAMTVSLVWRSQVPVASGMHDVAAIDVKFQIPAMPARSA
jgi:hypothetical protein